MRERYQKGNLQLKTKAGGLKVWVYRYREYTPEGSITRRATPIGTLKQFPTKAAAWRKCDALRATINVPPQPTETLFDKVIDRYIREEMPARFSTRHGYSSYLALHVRPQWKEHDISTIDPYSVEAWLKGLNLASKTRGHIKGIMHVIFECAMRWKLIPTDRNPMSLVRVKYGTRRKEKPRVLTLEEFEKLVAAITSEHVRTMVLAAMCLGLRVSELFALKWSDFDWKELTLSVQRGIVRGRVDEVKTEASHAHVPLDADLATVFFNWRRKTQFGKDADWVFASPAKAGEVPYLSATILTNHIKPAAKRAGLGEIGWHTFRHSYRSWLDETGAPIKVQQELMRHADIRTTMNVYGSAMSETKRQANSKVVKMALRSA